MNKVYLAGGMRSNWQDKVKESAPNLTYYDPKDNDPKMNLEQFGTWDLHHVKMCDVVFAYMEKTNPSGFGMAVEMGYAKGLGKTVILCIETGNEYNKDKYLDFMRKVSDVVFEDFSDAINYFKSF